uniref:Uncharacterized protein n=1 Tax=Anguilla anguilla TaxID=7936 RepID=A0A0E9VH60_ANGAN
MRHSNKVLKLKLLIKSIIFGQRKKLSSCLI